MESGGLTFGKERLDSHEYKRLWHRDVLCGGVNISVQSTGMTV